MGGKTTLYYITQSVIRRFDLNRFSNRVFKIFLINNFFLEIEFQFIGKLLSFYMVIRYIKMKIYYVKCSHRNKNWYFPCTFGYEEIHTMECIWTPLWAISVKVSVAMGMNAGIIEYYKSYIRVYTLPTIIQMYVLLTYTIVGV